MAYEECRPEWPPHLRPSMHALSRRPRADIPRFSALFSTHSSQGLWAWHTAMEEMWDKSAVTPGVLTTSYRESSSTKGQAFKRRESGYPDPSYKMVIRIGRAGKLPGQCRRRHQAQLELIKREIGQLGRSHITCLDHLTGPSGKGMRSIGQWVRFGSVGGRFLVSRPTLHRWEYRIEYTCRRTARWGLKMRKVGFNDRRNLAGFGGSERPAWWGARKWAGAGAHS